MTSIFLAKLIGPVMLAIGSALLINARGYRAMARGVPAQPRADLSRRLITLPAGLAIVLTHNVWTADWRVIITLLGWLASIGGASASCVPQHVARRRPHDARQARRPCTIGGAIWLVIGALLCFFGYFR